MWRIAAAAQRTGWVELFAVVDRTTKNRIRADLDRDSLRIQAGMAPADQMCQDLVATQFQLNLGRLLDSMSTPQVVEGKLK
jgi:hypothetical protein